MRKRFSGKTYRLFEQCLNAERAERINVALDDGQRVFGDEGPDKPGTVYEVDEALEPLGNGIRVRTKCGRTVIIYSLDIKAKEQSVDYQTPSK